MNIRPFRFWCYKVLPLVYDDSLSYYEVLCKVVKYINEMLEELETAEKRIDGLDSALKQLREYVDHYFDNLDVQEEINNKLDEMAESGELDAIIGEWLYRTPMHESFDAIVAGQFKDANAFGSESTLPHVPKSVQGMVIFRLNGQIYGACTRNTGLAGEYDGRIQIMELSVDSDGRLNGSNTGSSFVIHNLGHGNCMTFCDYDNLLYVACGGGANGINKIIAIDPLTLVTEKEFDFSHDVELQNCAGITWDSVEQKFYLTERAYIRVFDKDMHFTGDLTPSVYPRYKSTDTGAQSLFTDGKYIYQIYGVGFSGGGTVNAVSIYHIKGLSYYKTATVLIEGELESGCYFEGKYYMMTNNGYIGVVYEVFPYADRNIGDFEFRNKIRSFNLPDAELSTENDLYSDFDYYGFRVDGTNSTYPYGRLQNAISDASYRMDTIRLDLHVAGSDPGGVNIKKFEGLQVSGYTGVGGGTPSIKFAYVRDGSNFEMSNITIREKGTGIGDNYCYLINITRFRLINVTFGGEMECANLLKYSLANGGISNCKFNAPYTGYAVNGEDGGDVYFGGGNQFNAGTDMRLNRYTELPDGDNWNTNLYAKHNAYDVKFINSPTNFDITRVRRNGNYKVTGAGSTFVNVPDAITGNFGFTCNNLAAKDVGGTNVHAVIYDVVTDSGVYYKAILTGTGVFTWYDITGTVVGTFNVTV